MRFDDTTVQGILQGRRVIGRVAFPGSDDIEIGVQLISEREIDLARFEAQTYLDRQAKKVQLALLEFVQIDPESLDREHQRQVILRAFVDVDAPANLPPDKRVPFFPNIEAVRTLDSVMTQALWELYVDWQDTINPRVHLTEEEVSELIASLKEEPTANILLAHFERDTLHRLLRILVTRLQT